MKHTLFLILALFTILACNKSETPELTLSEKVQGDWWLYSFVINSCPNESDNLNYTTSDDNGCVISEEDPMCIKFNFAADGTGVIESESTSQPLVYTINEQTNSISVTTEDNDPIEFNMENGRLSNIMDEDGCICVFEFEHRD